MVKQLIGVVGQLVQPVDKQSEEIDQLKDEVNVLKGEKKKPTFKGSQLDKKTTQAKPKHPNKRPGSNKRNKNHALTIHQDIAIKPEGELPPNARFKGYRDFVVQDIKFERCNTRFRLGHWITAGGVSM